MTRWRPPSQRASPYITPSGFARLRAEYGHLWRERRPEVVKALSAAAAEGDRSENAEYQYRKKELREIDRRVRYLQTRIPNLTVVDRRPDDPQRVFFGACVEYVDDDGESHTVQIVGGDEAAPAEGSVSVDSPLARSLLGRALGDSVVVEFPAGTRELEIVEVSYPASSDS